MTRELFNELVSAFNKCLEPIEHKSWKGRYFQSVHSAIIEFDAMIMNRPSGRPLPEQMDNIKVERVGVTSYRISRANQNVLMRT